MLFRTVAGRRHACPDPEVRAGREHHPTIHALDLAAPGLERISIRRLDPP